MHPNGPSTDAVSYKLLSATAFSLIDRSIVTVSKKYLKDITYKENIMRNNTIQHRYNRDCSYRGRDIGHLSTYLQRRLWQTLLFAILMLLMPHLSLAADTIRVNIPRVTVTMARSYNFTSAANSVYVPVEFNSAMSADKVADYIEESAPLQGQSSFYGSMFGTGESGHAKTRRVYEPSELNRVSQEYKPGSAYTNKNISYSYETNSANEVFNLRVNLATGALHTDGSYPYYDAGTLFKDVATDEDGKVFTTYKDVAGRLIMEKRGADSKTYYVYDDRGFLSWVITPAESALLSSSANWSKTSANAVNHCYIYSHDYRGNITEKSIPGAGTSEYVYDKGGRLVLERDANLKGKNRWIYHVYDNIGREIECNLVQGTASVTRVSAQTNYNNLSINNSYPQLGGGTPDTPPSAIGNFTLICKLSQTRFGGGVYRTTSSTQTSSFAVPSYLAFSPVSGVAESADLDNVKVIGYKLYEKIVLLDGSENGNTGSNNTGYIERAFHYDRKGRVMQVVEKNSTGGISMTSTKYDFRGNILAVNENHSAGALTITKGTVYSYDQRGRLLSERVSINGAEKATVNYSYDALGNLTGKSYGNGVTDNLQYNIQGWGTVSQTVKGSETLYSQRLSYYDAEKGSGLYNGNISEWRMQQGTNAASTYRYSYDGLGRLTTSSRYVGTTSSATNSWCERGIDYDLNGNIVTLQRFGSNASAVEDNLSYSYNGNRLTALTGSSQGAELNASYSYDAGGNMLYDGRRGLGISYNILNLPAKVVEKTGATAADGAVKAEYLYSADGIKQRVVDGVGSNGYLYLGTLVLSKSGESYTLSSTGFGGGRIIGTANNSCLAYYYGTDHLGSVRVITDGSGSVVERNDYYPLGMRTATGNSYPQLTANLYKYNGKEVQTVGRIGFTDYGARMYDDFTGRWFVPDPLAEKYASMSPYMYCGGNPISMVDVDGRDWYQGKVKDGRMGIEWKNSQDLTIEDDDGITWTNIGENYIKENFGLITLYTQGKDKDGNLYKQSSEYYLDDESSMADLRAKVADLSSKGSAIAGGIGFLAKKSNATFRLTNSKGSWNPKFYKAGWRGNQWVTPYSVSKLSNGVDFFGKTLGIIGVSASAYQFMHASTLEGKVEHGLDIFMGGVGFVPGIGTGVSLYWSFGGKDLHYMYVERVLIPQIKMGINPGLPVYQTFK